MKRSQVIKKIAKILSEAKIETNEVLADRILVVIQQMGMLPPTNEFDPEFPGTPNYRWSKEEEEK